MRCKNCGSAMDDEDRYCSQCGQIIEAATSVDGNQVNVRSHVFNFDTMNVEPRLKAEVCCPICGANIGLTQSFKCKECSRTVCRKHQDKKSYLCEDCECARLNKGVAEPREPYFVHPTLKNNGEDATKIVKIADNCLWIKLAEGIGMEFLRVPGGKFTMGSNDATREKPIHEVELDAYWIGKFPVTNMQYRVFVEVAKYRVPDHWKNGFIPTGKETHPVVWVNWEDAISFCKWLSPQVGCLISLPSEAQWEKAARGTDGRRYPWGNKKPSARFCNWEGSHINDTNPVGKFSLQGDSPYECADMAGNVNEWVKDWYHHAYYGQSPIANPTGPTTGKERVLRGGSWFVNEHNVCTTYRSKSEPQMRNSTFGFRCVLV